jgi:hypothetical protein
MHRDRDFDPQQPPDAGADALVADLGLETLVAAMAGDDRFRYGVCKAAILLGVQDVDAVRYRQRTLQDCIANETAVRQIHDICLDSINGERRHFWGRRSEYPGTLLQRSVEVLQMHLGNLKKLRRVADLEAAAFKSEGFTRFFGMLREELSDAYFAEVEAHLKRLLFRGGVLISAALGNGLKGVDHLLHVPTVKDSAWPLRVLRDRDFGHWAPVYTFHIADRDESGARILSELRDRGITLVADALARSTDHVLGFLNALRTELAFYLGCLNLYHRLQEQDVPVCFPEATEPGTRRWRCAGLRDAALALSTAGEIVGNDVRADDRDLIMITGANQGGKTTFLRSVGQSHVMMRCGLFVAATEFAAELSDGIFTHFKREEDASMRSGKLDEELRRISQIVDVVKPNALVLFNESFASTNEREGSEIGRQIVQAFLESSIRVFFVTHQFDLADGLFQQARGDSLFLRAERKEDGTRTFRLLEGEPLDTSFGADLYRHIFAEAHG